MSRTQPLPPKRDVALALLERSTIFVHLDPRPTAVVVPASYKSQPQLVLQVGLNMPVPIPDLRFDDDGMSCTLSFGGAPFYCVVPWSSVFAMIGDDGQGMVWPDDVPTEVARQARPMDATRKELPKPTPVKESRPEPPKAKRPRKRPALAAVPKAVEAEVRGILPPPAPLPVRRELEPAPAVKQPAVGGARKRRELPPYLRVVK